MSAESPGASALPFEPRPEAGPAAAQAAPPQRPKGRLFRKYVLFFVGLVGVALLVNGGFDFWFGYQENKAALIRVQQEKADAAAQRIQEFIEEIERQIGWTTHAQWSAAPLDQRRFDYVRLLSQVPAITEISELDGDGKEQLKVSRLAIDAVGSGQDFSQAPAFTEARAHKIWFSPVYFRKESEPYMTLALARAGRNAGVTIAEVNLKLIWDVITGLKIGQGGYAYVVDAHGRLIAHPDISLVLRDTDFQHLPQVAAALAQSPAMTAVSVARDNAGRSVLSAHAAIAPLGWLVFVEVPLREAFAPLYGAALRSAVLMVLGLGGATLAALFLARRMTGPIREMQEGAARIGAGDLDRRLDIHTGDELEALAQQFNNMAAGLQTSYAELEHKVEERTAELSEALDQQTATAEVLQVINSSPGNLAPVFDAMLEKATSLCEAAYGVLWTYDGQRMSPSAVHGEEKIAAALRDLGPLVPAEGSLGERLLQGERVVHITNAEEDQSYRVGSPARRALVDVAHARTLLGVALRKDNRVLGLFSIYRQEVRPFTDKQTALLENFAAQAVIAIENARLITETQEALDQQTAAAEVLQVINSSPGDLQPVFDIMLDKAMHLCGAAFGMMMVTDGRQFPTVAALGVPPAFAEFRRHNPVSIEEGPVFARLVGGETFVHSIDLKDDEAYRRGIPQRLALVDLGGARTSLVVALRKDDALLGLLQIYRQEVRPFSDKQIALLQNFAAQAVIAMENARLITETREALDQQTATAEVLGVINSSPGDLAPVFDAILEKAHSLCGAALGALGIYDGEKWRAVTLHSYREPLAERLRQGWAGPDHPFVQPLLDGARFAQFSDLAQIDHPIARAAFEAGIRTLLIVSLRKDEALLGTISAARLEARPFSDKEIALLENFAAQAVIAIENARLITETQEALEQQTATAEVLGVINASPGDLAPVFDAILDKAHALCGATRGTLFLFDGDIFRAAAVHGYPEELAEQLRQGGSASPTSVFASLFTGARLVHNPDLREVDNPLARAVAERGGVRTNLLLPLRKDDVLLGVISCNRQEVRPFTDKQIALLENFAAQAVIAIENARLITETQEALDQQTATAEVLGVINSSPGDLAPVFEAMLEKAMRLCEATFGQLAVYEDGRFRTAAARGMPAAWADYRRRNPPDYGPGTQPARLLAGEPLIHIRDLIDDDAYRAGEPNRRALVDLGGVRTSLMVPLRREGQFLGFINIYRQEVRPFSDKDIALLQNFAAQAVIAMENARLLGETQEALDRQTATAEVLQVINSSPGNLAPVFEAMLEKAIDLCDGIQGTLWTFDGERAHLAASQGLSPKFVEMLRARREHENPGDHDPVRRIMHGERLVQILDVGAERLHGQVINAAAEFGGVGTIVFVALVKDTAHLGAFAISRRGVQAFTDKQIALLQNFAAQAVIAMENARLMTETRSARDVAEGALGDLRTAQASLIQAEKMASLGQLTAGIAHEIKNPLNFVNNFASLSVELLEELKEAAAPGIAALGEDKREEVDETMAMLSGNLEKIGEHGRRADNIVKSMLEHSRGVTGERREVDLNALVEESLNLAYHGARAQDQSFNITLERAFDPALQPIELVPQDMTRVFLNLFGNGFYAANKRAQAAHGASGGDGAFRPVLTVATREAGDAIEIRVRDNGTGIPSAIRDKLFQPFFTTKPTGEGTGLGLSISYDIVTQQHGGTIAVASEEGAFTEFTIRLPRGGQATRPAAPARAGT